MGSSDLLPFALADATRGMLQWLNEDNVKDRFEGGVPRDFRKVLDGWEL